MDHRSSPRPGAFCAHRLPAALAAATILAALACPRTAHAQAAAADFRSELSPASSLVGKPIARIQFSGNRKVEDAAIRVNLVSKKGAPLALDKIRSDIRSLWKMGLFDDVRVLAEAEGDGVVITFVVTEKPSIRKVYISGNDDLSLEDINKVIDLRRDSILDVAKVKANREKIHDLYVEEGFYLADVKYEVRPVNESEVDVWFIIDESSKVEIREISFIGNRKVSDETLRSITTTKEGGYFSFISDSGVFKQDKFERDLLLILSYYYDHGFIRAKVGTPKIRLSGDKRYMYLSIPIDEGPVFRIGKIDFQGDIIGKKSDYYSLLTIKPGDIFNRSQVSRDIKAVNDLYKNLGYAYVNVTPLNQINVEDLTVDLSFKIEKGEKVYFERINIRGNTSTRDKVIRREMQIAEGQLYSQTALEESRERIMALGFFTEVNVSTTRGSEDQFIIVNVEVAERPTGTFQIGAGFSSVENFIAQAQISENNLFGRGQTLSVQLQISSLRQLYMLQFVEPYFLDTKWNFAFNLYNTSQGFGTFARNATGGSLTWGRRLSYEIRAFLTYKLETVDVSTGGIGLARFGSVREPVEAESVANLYRGGITSSVSGSVVYDSRNNRLFPSKGWYHSLFLEVAESAFGSENVFVRYGGSFRHYRPLFGPFVLKLRAMFGVVTSRDPLGVPITERYLIGGINSVRGFAPRTLGPRLRVSQPGDVGQPLAQIPLGGNLQLVWNSEIEFPLFKQIGISGIVFYDMGNAYNLEDRYCSGSAKSNDISSKFDPCFRFPSSVIDGLRKSVGFGVRWFSPIGPLRFEWGIPLDRQPGEDSLVFEFTIGNFF